MTKIIKITFQNKLTHDIVRLESKNKLYFNIIYTVIPLTLYKCKLNTFTLFAQYT